MANSNEITVTIQGDSAQLVQALEKAEKSLENFGNSAEKVADSMSGIKSGLVNFAALTESFQNVYSAVSSIGQALINTFVAVGDELDKMADRTNISVENLSKLKYAAEMSGSGFDTVIDGLKTFNEQLGAARLGDMGAIGKLGAVGIKSEDFAGLDEHSAFLKLADHIASIKDSAIQTRTAIELFGDAGWSCLLELAERVLGACPDSRWRLIFTLGRWGGLRIPSELAFLRWSEIDWDGDKMKINVPKKTSRIEQERGNFAFRWLPLFPEIRKALEEYRDEYQEPDEDFVFPELDGSESDGFLLRRELNRILKDAKIRPWQKLFVNLRATRDTELQNRFPVYQVGYIMGHTPQVSLKHYAQVTDDVLKQMAYPQ